MGFIAKKMDRIVVNEFWLQQFDDMSVDFKSPDFSDHFSREVFSHCYPIQKSRCFKFFNFLNKHKDFHSDVQSVWLSKITRSFMFQLCQKLKALKPLPKTLNKENFSDLHCRVIQTREALSQLQATMLSSLSPDLVPAERDLSSSLIKLLDVEESFLRQRSRIKWLMEEDQITGFFHKIVKGKLAQTRITSLLDSKGKSHTSEDDIKKEILEFYKGLLGTEDLHCNGGTVSGFQSLLKFYLPPDFARKLVQPFTREEVKAVVFDQPSNKSPGPDGYTNEFLKATWGIMDDLVIAAVMEFFSSWHILKAI